MPRVPPLGFGRSVTTSLMSDAELHRLQLQLFGPRELEEADDHLVEPPDLVGDDVHVLRQIDGGRGPGAGARATGAGSRTAAELLLQQLEVDRHRVERVLHLVRDAGHQPAERGQLARVVQRRCTWLR